MSYYFGSEMFPDDPLSEASKENQRIKERRVAYIRELYNYDPEVIMPIHEQSILPTREHYYMPRHYREEFLPGYVDPKYTVYPTDSNFSFMGPSRAGKTTIFDILKKIYKTGHFYDEFSTENLDEDMLVLLEYVNNFPLEARNLLLTSISVINHNQIFLNIRNANDRYLAEGNKEVLQPSFLMRGPNDIIAFSMWLYFKSFGSDQVLDPFFNNALEEAVDFIDDIDAVILFTMDFEEAKKRRVAQGLSATGRMVTEEYWPIAENGYRWWVQYVYPYLRDEYGIGLLIVDGTRSKYRNQKRVVKYVADVRKWKKRLRAIAKRGPYWQGWE